MLQLDRFRKELNHSIRNNEREIIFIHGIGNGTLKNELRRVGLQEYKWCSQEDASFKEYGFGATRIRIPQNKP
jgi:dsDNA-specific endonuclease/ATPase MutS2